MSDGQITRRTIDRVAPELADIEPLPWMAEASCASVDPELMYPEKGGNPNAAKRVCRGCPVRTECATYALELGDDWGVFGGLTAVERVILRRRGWRPGDALPDIRFNRAEPDPGTCPQCGQQCRSVFRHVAYRHTDQPETAA